MLVTRWPDRHRKSHFRWQMRQHDCWLPVGSLLAVRWLMRHRPTGDCWQEPTKALWLLAKFLKKVNDFNGLLAWHSRGRGFDSLQLHHEACQGVTEKSVTPFSLAPCQLTANAPVGSDSPGPGRLTHLPPHPGGDLLKIFNRLPGKKSSSPLNFSLRIWTFGLSRCVGGRKKAVVTVSGRENAFARRGGTSA